MKTRNAKYDGKLFVGAKTSGIYCIPSCVIAPPKEKIEFFKTALEAEEAGYSPCFRCHPDNYVEDPNKVGSLTIVERALKMLDFQELIEFDENKFADLFGISARHLRRLFVKEIGKTPKQIYFEKRLNLAKQLLVDTNIPISAIIFDSGFNSVRRFNDAFKDRYHKNPSEIRLYPVFKNSHPEISLPYILPFNFKGLMSFYKAHQIGDLEWFVAGKMYRVVHIDNEVGLISIANDHKNSCILLNIDFPNALAFPNIIARVKILMDLSIDPIIINNKLGFDEKVKIIIEKHPGTRLPSGWDAFEMSIFTILGQSISMRKNQTGINNLIKLLGEDSGLIVNNRSIQLFPTVEKILISDLSSLKINPAKQKTLIDFCKCIIAKTITFDSTQDVTEFSNKILAIEGMTPAVVHCLSLRILNYADAFPDTHFIFARILELHDKAIIDRMAPYRGYAAALLWVEYVDKMKRLHNKKSHSSILAD
ncbi:MAG: AlkA N-terminal domain-containing protein [Pseudomonadota bacterium]